MEISASRERKLGVCSCPREMKIKGLSGRWIGEMQKQWNKPNLVLDQMGE